MKNVVLSFLTIFHEELDSLIDEELAAEADEAEDPDEREWATI